MGTGLASISSPCGDRRPLLPSLQPSWSRTKVAMRQEGPQAGGKREHAFVDRKRRMETSP